MKIQNYDEVRERIGAFLPEYLESQGVDASRGQFRCISPQHEDRSPSCGITGSGKVFNCFGCGASGSIFHAAHFLEGKPLVGTEFITDNLLYLAEKFNINVEMTPLTEEEIYQMDTHRAYSTVSDYLTHGVKDSSFLEAINARMWSTEICQEFGIGCISDYRAFREALKSMGFQAGFLDDVDLSRKDIFGEAKLIFSIRDEHGRPVGFAARDLNYTEGNGAKYVNQKHTGVKCNIYKKSTRLFGLDRLLRLRRKRNQPVYLFEGYSDVVTAAQHGIKNAVALGGTALTVEQVQLLKQFNLYNVVLCLDGDTAGQERTAAILDNVLSGHKDLNVKVIIIPDGMDPDDFLREKGVDKFKRLKKQSAFEWRLSRFDPETDDNDVCKAMVPLIVNETSYIEQERQCKLLARATSVSLSTIKHEVDRLQNIREAEKSRERKNIIDKMMTQIQRSPDEIEAAMHEAEGSLFDLARKFDEDSFSLASSLSVLDAQKTYEESKDGTFSGFILGEDLKGLQNALAGEWKKDVWLCFGGKANSGKTSLMCKMAYEIARHAENNALVIYHSIDDTAQQLIPKFVCIAEGSRQLTLNEVMDPNYHSGFADQDGQLNLFNKRDAGYDVIRGLIKDGRLVLKDANDGRSISFADRLIRYYRERYPDRNIVYILDNFHKLRDFQTAQGDERVRFKTVSTVMKDLATKHHIAVLATVEYRKIKRGDRAGNEDIIETGQIEYDANLIAHLFNDVHESGDKAEYFHDYKLGHDLVRMPTVELDIGKNKITAFKNRLYLDFFPSSSDFEEADMGAIAKRQAEADAGRIDETIQFVG
jgi:DNA primase